MATHAELIAKTLARAGVRNLFGLPGGEIVSFIDACRREGLRFILAGHETSAAYMAQVTGHLSGTPGVCAATLGPGATNLVTGVANAFLDRAPLLAFTAQLPAASLATMSHQRLALDRLFAPVTKTAVTFDGGDSVRLTQSALELAAAPRPGPVHLALPSDLAVSQCEPAKDGPERSERRNGAAALAEIAARIRSCKRPLVLAGLGAGPSSAPLVRAFAGRLAAPYMVTPKAKGILPENDPLFLGVASGMAIDREIVETLRAADLVIAIGFDPVECDKTWFAEIEVVALDSARMSEGGYRPCEAVGDLEAMLAALTAEVAPKPWSPDLLAARRRAINRTPAEGGGGLSPLRLIEELRGVMPPDTIAACDVGSHKLVMGQFWRTDQPGTFLVSNGLSGMGFGLPAALAAQLTYPDRPVMAAVGDGGMLMTLHDLVLLRELNLPVIVVVFSDASLSLIRVSQHRRGLEPYGVDFTGPDFAAVACAFGIPGRRAKSAAEVRAAVESALEGRTPLVLDVAVDFREYYELV